MQARDQVGGGDATEIETLATGNDGCRQFLQLGGGQNEDHVCRGLFQGFEQCIEGTLGEHMHLVDDIHAVFQLGGGIDDLVADVADIIYAVVGCGIHFQHVGSRSRVNGAAGGALAAGACGRQMLAVDRLGQDLGAGGLTRSARSAEQVGVGELPCRTFIFQNGGNVILTADFIKVARPPLAV